MNCNKYSKMMTDFLSGEISGEDKSALCSHLSSCETCRKEFEQLKEVWVLTESALKADFFGETLDTNHHENIFTHAMAPALPPKKSKIIKFYWLELAAGITIVVIFAGIFAPTITKMVKTGFSNKASADGEVRDEMQLTPRSLPEKPSAVAAPAMSPAMEMDKSPMKQVAESKSRMKEEEASVTGKSAALESDKPDTSVEKERLDMKKTAGASGARPSTKAPASPLDKEAAAKSDVTMQDSMEDVPARSAPLAVSQVSSTAPPGGFNARKKSKDQKMQPEPQIANALAAAPTDKPNEKGIVLDDKQQLMLKRVTELLKEAGHWHDYPLKAVRFDAKRSQWEFQFTDMKPDSGVFAYIKDENAEEIEILLFPPTWTKYKRK
ncbi:MAG: zf-HC2 domain-containing protein [Victivallales bacterium]